jgi:two-component system, response regulator, stage 0 sporulation protein F
MTDISSHTHHHDRKHRAERWGVNERILLAEDDRDVRMGVRSVLELFGYRVEDVSNGLALLRAVQTFVHAGAPPALVLADQRMPVMNGLEVAAELRRRGWRIPVALMTAFGDDDLAEEARRAGILMLRKPFEVEDLITLVGYIIDRHAPALPKCAACGATDDLHAADDGANVFFCRSCRAGNEEFDPSDPRFDLGGGD